MRIGDRIRQIRLLRGLTQAELGEKIHLKGDRIRQYENSVRNPKEDKVAEIADALDVDISVFSDLDISSDENVMQILFELEDRFGLHLKREENQYTLCFDDENLSDSMKRYLNVWYEKSEKDTPKLSDANYEIERKKMDYNLWKLRFPSVLTKRNYQEEVYYRYQPLIDKISGNHPEIKLFSDIIKQLTKMMQSGIEMSFASKKVKYAVLEGIITFSDQHLLHLSEPSDHYFAEFLCDIKTLENYGVKIRLDSHWDGEIAYSDYIFRSNEIGTLLSGMKKIQKQINEGKFETQFKQVEYGDFIKDFDITIVDSIKK